MSETQQERSHLQVMGSFLSLISFKLCKEPSGVTGFPLILCILIATAKSKMSEKMSLELHFKNTFSIVQLTHLSVYS